MIPLIQLASQQLVNWLAELRVDTTPYFVAEGRGDTVVGCEVLGHWIADSEVYFKFRQKIESKQQPEPSYRIILLCMNYEHDQYEPGSGHMSINSSAARNPYIMQSFGIITEQQRQKIEQWHCEQQELERVESEVRRRDELLAKYGYPTK